MFAESPDLRFGLQFGEDHDVNGLRLCAEHQPQHFRTNRRQIQHAVPFQDAAAGAPPHSRSPRGEGDRGSTQAISGL
jgi:hypothetical protein